MVRPRPILANRALEIEPNHAVTLRTRAEVQLRKGNLDAALADSNRALEIEPNHAVALRTRAEVHRLKGNLDNAFADANRALEIEPNHVFALRTRSKVHYKNSNEREGVLDEIRAFELSKTTQVPSLKSLCKSSFFKHESRIVAAGTAFRLDPDAVRNTLIATGITPITIATMREKQNGTAVIGAKTIFDQLDFLDMERLFRASSHRSSTASKRPAEEALHREDKTPKSGRQ